jgi:hypothetical protein
MKPLRELFINRLKLRGFSKRTIVTYTDAVHRITRHFMRSPLDLTKEQIESYRLFLLNEKKFAPRTINLHMDAMRTFFKLMAPECTVTEGLFRMKVPRHLPDAFVRIRYFGFLGQAVKKERLRQCRELLGVAEESDVPQEEIAEGTCGQKKLWQCPLCRQGRLAMFMEIPRPQHRNVEMAAVA